MTDGIKINEMKLREEAMWGAKNIAHFACVSVDRVYEWAKLPDCPIYQPDGKVYLIYKSEFIRWIRRKKSVIVQQLPASPSIAPD
jgi:hypothetical protein